MGWISRELFLSNNGFRIPSVPDTAGAGDTTGPPSQQTSALCVSILIQVRVKLYGFSTEGICE